MEPDIPLERMFIPLPAEAYITNSRDLAQASVCARIEKMLTLAYEQEIQIS